ncbi:transcription factor IIIA-like isoform X2 [Rhodnius prolixus]|uniref:transcription factor IIIA-like isoform X2 n=1 Tax=Rhodnius prolixus TaxID=13249 RepID=UPI003D1885F8
MVFIIFIVTKCCVWLCKQNLNNLGDGLNKIFSYIPVIVNKTKKFSIHKKIRAKMAFGSESEESEGVSNIIFSKIPETNRSEGDRTLIKSAAYWKSIDPTNNLKKKSYCCLIQGCSASFSRPWRLNAHLSVHYGKKPFSCDVNDCNKAYTSLYHLRRHKSAAHESVCTSTKIFKCEFPGCTATFKTQQNAKKHLKRTHEGRTCKECGKVFAKRSQLMTHQYDHTGIVPYKCVTCDIGFLRKTELRRHERGHREHICPEKRCFLTFKSWSEVRKHLITHPRNYVCILCRKSYVCRKNLKEHILKHSDPSFTKKRKTLLETFQCEHCSASIVGKASLKRHIAVIHEGKRGQGKDPSVTPKKRAVRKDKGCFKKAIASALSEVKVPLSVEKKLLQQAGDDLISDEEIRQEMLPFLTLQESLEQSQPVSTDDDASSVQCS